MRRRLIDRLVDRFRALRQPPQPPTLPLLEYVRDPGATRWLRATVTTFARSVASFLPGSYEAYARVYHPFERNDRTATWRETAEEAGVPMPEARGAEDFAYHGSEKGQAHTGSLHPDAIRALVEHLRGATGTPDRCWFALWEGFGDCPVPRGLEPTLELPQRRYHVFTGPLEGALTSLSDIYFVHRSPSLWWPEDRAWFVATEVDFAWTYVGGPRACIDALLADARLEAVETRADAIW